MPRSGTFLRGAWSEQRSNLLSEQRSNLLSEQRSNLLSEQRSNLLSERRSNLHWSEQRSNLRCGFVDDPVHLVSGLKGTVTLGSVFCFRPCVGLYFQRWG